jgi:hypothetical protein
MDPKQKEIAERDQLWATLRVLREDIDVLASGGFDGGERHRKIIGVLARVIASELDYRQRSSESS